MEQWYIYCKKADFRYISEKFNISPMLARILINRGIGTDEEIDLFLNGKEEDMYDPFLFKDMDRAVCLICDALENKEKIRVIGDYDADGVCSSYIFFHFLEHLGADVSVRLPDRFKDGYGMNEEMVLEAKRANIGLIITCDNGISAKEPVALAKSLGIKVLITDHHEPPSVLPDADVIIDPKIKESGYPYAEICGAAVAYKVMLALSRKLDRAAALETESILDDLLMYAGIAAVTDIVPLKDENRLFVKAALKRLKKTDDPGLKALMDIKSVDAENISAYHIGFIIGPAINSAGRLRSADMAFDLINETGTQSAYEKAKALSDLNEERKDLTLKYTQAALEAAQELIKTDRVLVIYLPDAPESVAGIIAGKVKDSVNAPSIVITSSSEGLKGSGRSIEGYNMIEEISKFPELFSKFGGHALACGFTLKCSPKELSDALNKNCRLTKEDLIKKVWIDMQLPFKYATKAFAKELKKLEPFGMDNERPLFAQKNVRVLSFRVVGKNLNGLKMSLKDESDTVMDGIMFAESDEIGKTASKIKEDPVVSITYFPEINEFRGKETVRLKVTALR